MNINILIQDLYLDFTHTSEVNLERRFFVELETKENEVLSFCSEMNSAFIKYHKLHNMLALQDTNILEEFSKNMEDDKNQSHKELLILDKTNLYTNLPKMVLANIESLDENSWLSYCKNRYEKHKVEFTEDKKNLELRKFHESNEKFKQIWQKFPETMNEFIFTQNAEQITNKFNQLWNEAQYHYLDKKYKEQNIKDKKHKI